MINWCIENPVRGTRLDADSPQMRALEAYIWAQRKGTPLNYGKH
jgi:thiosulfate dehydrogenase